MHGKDGAFPGLALDVDLPLHQLNEPVSNRESQAGSAILACNRGIRLSKLLKQVLSLLGGNPNPRVANAELNALFVLRLDLIHIHGDGAVIRKFACITQQIEQYLPDFRNVRLHRAHVLRNADID